MLCQGEPEKEAIEPVGTCLLVDSNHVGEPIPSMCMCRICIGLFNEPIQYTCVNRNSFDDADELNTCGGTDPKHVHVKDMYWPLQ